MLILTIFKPYLVKIALLIVNINHLSCIPDYHSLLKFILLFLYFIIWSAAQNPTQLAVATFQLFVFENNLHAPLPLARAHAHNPFMLTEIPYILLFKIQAYFE